MSKHNKHNKHKYSVVPVTTEEYRALVRYEITWPELAARYGADPEKAELQPENADLLLSDLETALTNIRRRNPLCGDFIREWLNPIDRCSMPDFVWSEDTYLPRKEENVRLLTMIMLWSANRANDDETICSALNIDKMQERIARWHRECGRPIDERTFTEEEQLHFADLLVDEDYGPEAVMHDDEAPLARRCIDYACAQGNKNALYFKAYACYNGRIPYTTDFYASRECLSRLYELTGDPGCANSLAYIAYYGRCTGGQPDYDTAFRLFGYAAANGLTEAIYKLGDCYANGYGCRKSPETAANLYHMVYRDEWKKYQDGENDNFADAALRIGSIYERGIGCQTDPVRAYRFYLQADYAARQRAKHSDFFGDATVAVSAANALAAEKAKLPEGFLRDAVPYAEPAWLDQLCENRRPCVLRRKTLKNGDVRLSARRLPNAYTNETTKILLTEPRLSLCKRTDHVRLTAVKPRKIRFRGDADSVKFDYIRTIIPQHHYELYYQGERTAVLRGNIWQMEGHAQKAADETAETVRLCGIRFRPDGQRYDYLCGDFDPKPGDRVIVSGYSGLTTVEVVAVETRKVSELPLARERYKDIVGMAEDRK